MVNGVKLYGELFIFNIFGVYVSLVYSNLNVEEIYGVKYGFEISSEPVLLKESQDVGNTMLLSSKHGQQYECVLPQLESLEKNDEEKQHISEDEIPQLLEPMKKKCLYNNKGWWTYEVCFGKGIYQYHQEANEVVGDKISLGLFSKETDWSQEKIDTKEKPKPGQSKVVKKYHSQYYMNGSDCDLTGKARETQVKIYCDEGSADLVFRVDEPSSCSYVITVYTNKLCQHSLFRSSPAQKPQAITCSPALSEERYKMYVERVESRKKAKEAVEAAKRRAQKARAAAKIESEDETELDEEERFDKTKSKTSKRSQVWPWENPGVESDDEVWIDGNIEQDQLGVHRLDITKGRKTSANGEHAMHEGITITSQTMHRKREPASQRQKGDTEETGQGHTDDNLKESSEHEEEQEQSTDQTASEREESKGGTDQDADETATEQNNEQESKGKEITPGDDGEGKGVESSVTPEDASKQIGKEGAGTEQGLDEEWKNKMDEAILKLRSSLKEKLVKLGIKPDVLDQKFEEKLGSVPRKDGVKDHTESHGESHAESHGESHSESPGGSHGESHGESHAEVHSESPGGSHGESHGESHSESHGESHSESHGESHSESHAESHSESHAESHSESSSESHAESHSGLDDQDVEKLEEKDAKVQQTEQQEQTLKKDPFARTIQEMKKILNEGMMKEIMEAASATQAEMERQFNEERAQMNKDVEVIKTKIKEIEEMEEKNGVKDEQLGKTMSKMKDSIDRFEKTNLELDEDMLSMKELNKELFGLTNKDHTEAKHDLIQLSVKTNKLLKKILLRRFQLEQDLKYITKTRSKISHDEQNAHSKDNTEFDATKGGIDKVINKLKTMIQDLDDTEAGKARAGGGGTAGEDSAEITPDSSATAGVEGLGSDSESGLFNQRDTGAGVKVKVSSIKKVYIGDDDEEMEETDVDEEEMEELGMEKRIRQATKKMEEMVKQQLRDSGVLPSGKIRVKIVTSKDALEKMGGKNDMKLLSEQEETQFRDMILGLLGGSPDAGKERKRQQDLEDNYNLVWNEDELQTVPREDDDADGEVEVTSF